MPRTRRCRRLSWVRGPDILDCLTRAVPCVLTPDCSSAARDDASAVQTRTDVIFLGMSPLIFGCIAFLLTANQRLAVDQFAETALCRRSAPTCCYLVGVLALAIS